MNSRGPHNPYQSNAVLTASPGRLIEMMLEGAIKFTRAAKAGFTEVNVVKRNEAIHNNLLKAQAIITELQASLNLETGSDFSSTMYRLYDFLHRKIQESNHTKTPEPLTEVEKILSEISDAWHQMLANNTN